MIIIKTSNGNVLINDQQMKMVVHDHVDHVVRLIDAGGTMGMCMRHPYATIEHVESIIYTNDAQPTEWKGEGSIIKEMQDIIDKQKSELAHLNWIAKRLQSDLRLYSSNIAQIIDYHTKEEMSDDIAKRIRDEAEKMKAKGNANIWDDHHPYDKEQPDSKSTETALIAELNEQLENSLANIRQLESKLKEADRMKEVYRQRSERLYARNLWQRIVNKTVEP